MKTVKLDLRSRRIWRTMSYLSFQRFLNCQDAHFELKDQACWDSIGRILWPIGVMFKCDRFLALEAWSTVIKCCKVESRGTTLLERKGGLSERTSRLSPFTGCFRESILFFKHTPVETKWLSAVILRQDGISPQPACFNQPKKILVYSIGGGVIALVLILAKQVAIY